MSPEEIQKLRKAKPFVPFRLHTENGQSYDIHDPEFLFVSKAIVCIGLAADSQGELPESGTWVTPANIKRVEMLGPAQP